MKIFVAWTVDHLEGLTASALMADNVEELRRISSDIKRATENVKAWAMAVGGAPVLDLGSVGVVEAPADRMTELPAIAKKFEEICDGTLSVGVGMTISEAYSAMKYSHLHGGDQISLYTPEMEDALTEQNDKGGDQLFADLGKSQKVGSEQPVGFAEGPPAEVGTAPPPTDPQHGQMHPAEGHDVQVGDPQVAQAAEGAMDAGGAPAPQGDPNGGQPTQEGAAPGEGGEEEDPRQFIVQALMKIKEQAPVLEQLKEANPEAFEAVKNVVQAMIQMAQGMTVDGGEGESVQKSEELAKGDVVKFPGNPAPAQDQGKAASVTAIQQPVGHLDSGSGADYTHLLQRHGVHQEGHTLSVERRKAGDGSHQLIARLWHPDAEDHKDYVGEGTMRVFPDGKVNYEGFGDPWYGNGPDGMEHFEAPVLEALQHAAGQGVKKSEYPPAKPHVELPTGAMKEGKIKVEHRDPATSASQGTGWNSVRSGQILSEDGHAVSSRNPSGR